MKIVLGSQSVERAELLRGWGYEFEQIAADIDEQAIRHDDPEQLVLELARAKAEVLSAQVPTDGLLITSDVVAICGGRVLEKPVGAAQAREFFELYGLEEVETACSLVLVDGSSGRQAEGVERTRLVFAPFSEELMVELVADRRTYLRAGGFSLSDQRFLGQLQSIEGQADAAIGLPRQLFDRLMIALASLAE